MKKALSSFMILLMVMSSISGCKTTDPRLHPNSTPNVIDFGGMQEFSMKAPTQTVKDANGNITEGPVFETVVVTDPATGKVTTTTKPILVSLKMKDQTMVAPKTGYDILDKFVGFLPFAWFGYLASDVAKAGINGAAKDPLVVKSVDKEPIIVSPISETTGESTSDIIYP